MNAKVSFLLPAENPAELREQATSARGVEELDALLSTALCGAGSLPSLSHDDAPALVDRVTYHGVAALLASEGRMARWPASVTEQVQSIALAQSMWELRHISLLRPLLASFSDEKIPVLLLKGTALAYDIYDTPAERARGDSDLLIDERHVNRARELLRVAGFASRGEGAFLPPALRSQESWSKRTSDGLLHCIDLHWRPLNSPALDKIFTADEWFANARPLPRLSDEAMAAGRPQMLLHACLHRSLHECAPYQVGQVTHFGGNRLIWLWDIRLLGRSMSDLEWRQFCGLARAKGVGVACRDGLQAAGDRLGPSAPDWVLDELDSGPASTAYLSGGQLRRAWLDWRAIPGMSRKLRYIRARILPDRQFMRAKYPLLRNRPLPVLYARRFAELLRRRR